MKGVYAGGPFVEVIQFAKHGGAGEDETDLEMLDKEGVQHAGGLQGAMQELHLLVAGVDFVDEDEGAGVAVFHLLEVGDMQFAVVENVGLERRRRLSLQFFFPTHIAHPCKDAHIAGRHDKGVVRVGGHQVGKLNHQPIHAYFGFFADADDATFWVLVEVVDDFLRIGLLVFIDVLGRGVDVALGKGETVLFDGLGVGIAHIFSI